MQKVTNPIVSLPALLFAQCAAAVRERRREGRIGAFLAIAFCIALGWGAAPASAQHEVTGEVVDADGGGTLPGVNIVVKGTQTGTTTRANGTYALETPSPTDTLVFSFIGYQEQEVPVDNRSEIDIMLEPAVTALEEVVVQVGYEERTVETVTGSVSQVSGADLEIEPTTNLSHTLQGTVPGLTGVTASGRPGRDNAQLLVRGFSTLNDNRPLVVIDGVPGRQGGLARLNASDIESVSVLKDASAAIYGSRAANGVILVQTKRGTAGETQINVNVEQGFSRPAIIPEMADAPTYLQMLNEVALTTGGERPYSQEEIDAYRNIPDGSWEYFDTNWYDEALKDYSSQTSVDASIMGGNESLRYRVSLGGLTEDGILVNSATNYDQFHIRSNLDGDITEALTLSLDLHGRLEDRNIPAWTRGLESAWEMLQRGKPNEPAFWPNGLPGPAQEQGVNPVVSDLTGYQNEKDYLFQSSLSLEAELPIDGWTAEGTVAYDQKVTDAKLWQEPWQLYSYSEDENGNPDPAPVSVGVPDPRLEQWDGTKRDILLRGTTRYETAVGNHHGSVLLGTEYQTADSTGMWAFRRYFPTDQIEDLFAGGPEEQDIDGSSIRDARLNFFGRASYNFSDRYLLELIGRYDGSYIFPKGDRFGFFPSVSAGWNVHREEWFSGATSDFFDQLRLRVSYGQTGNDRIESYQFLRTFGLNGQFAYGNGLAPRISPTRVPNQDITWEVATKFDLGLQTAVLDDRLTLDVTYFRELRDDILWWRNQSVPQSAGFSLPRENIGRVKSYGFDGEVGYIQEFSPDVTLRFGLTLSWAENEIVFMDEPEGEEPWQQQEGHPMNTGLYYVDDGIWNSQNEIDEAEAACEEEFGAGHTCHWDGARPGDVKFKDIDGDGSITGADRVRAEEDGIPDLIGGFNVAATVKQFDASLQFQGATQVQQYVFTQSAGSFGNYFQEFADERWRPDPDNPDEPHPDYLDATGPRAYNRTDPYWAANGNTFFLQDAKYLRLKSARVGYTVPPTWSEQFGLRQMRVSLTGRNLLTWSPLKIMDPEIRNGAAHSYPQEQTFSVELQVGF